MRVLVIGGTVFLGRAVVGAALARGDEVTVFNRGRSGPAPDGVEHVVGDRNADLDRLRGREFDVVVDTCGYMPADVAASAAALEAACGHYAFVSSISAYPASPAEAAYAARGVFDGNPDATADTVPADVEPWQHYGWRKVGCELAVRRAFGDDRCALLRAGAIVGPDDSAVGRLPWWLGRFARGGAILVPGAPADPIALIDARDLAAFALTGAPGTFECGGPAGRDSWAGLVGALQAATTGGEPVWVASEWLGAQDVEPWTEVPLWIGPDGGAGTWAHDNSAAEAAGLRWRPLAETVADTWAWQQTVPGGWRPAGRTPGLTPAREAELLAAWQAR